VKIGKCGKRVTKLEASTRCLSSPHELVESALDSCLMPKSENIIKKSTKFTMRPKEKVSLFYTYSNYYRFY